MTTALAPAPQRSTTSFHIGWGLIDIAVSAYTGTEETRVSRKEFVKDGDTLVSVGRAAIRKDTGEVIDSGDVIRMAQASSGEWVVLTDDEIAECTSPKGQAEIISFVPVKDVGQYLAENQMQVRPQVTKGKANPAVEKAFALLMKVMSTRKVVALVKIAMRGPARFALIDSTGTMTLIRTADAVRVPRPITTLDAVPSFTKAELSMASSLIDMVGIDTPVLTDDTAPVVAEFVNAKATGKPVEVKEAPSIAAGDLMAQLEASIAAKKSSRKVKAS